MHRLHVPVLVGAAALRVEGDDVVDGRRTGVWVLEVAMNGSAAQLAAPPVALEHDLLVDLLYGDGALEGSPTMQTLAVGSLVLGGLATSAVAVALHLLGMAARLVVETIATTGQQLAAQGAWFWIASQDTTTRWSTRLMPSRCAASPTGPVNRLAASATGVWPLFGSARRALGLAGASLLLDSTV